MRQLGPAVLALLAAAALGLAAACDGSDPVSFTHGVASGDVRPTGAVLWARADGEGGVVVEVARDEAFTDIVLEREARAESERDYTAKAEIDRLDPGTRYFYRFRNGDNVSETGTFSTAPDPGTAAPVRFVFSGDSDGTVQEDGTRAFDFRVLETLLREEPDFFAYFGDTIYADSPYGPDAETLDDYRAAYKSNRDIELLRAALAAMPVYVTWDDHEVRNNFAGTTVDRELLEAGRRAFREYMPIEGDPSGVFFRRFRWGSAVELIILDERSFRSPDVADACVPEGQEEPDLLPGLGSPDVPEPYRAFRSFIGLPELAPEGCLEAIRDPERTMLGAEQKQFLSRALASSDATFKFVINPVPISELIALPYDRWEGYRAERDEILRFIADNDIENVVFLTTDFHANMVSDVRVNLASRPVATEFITGPIAHTTLGDDITEAQGADAVGAFEALLTSVAGVECVELDAFSYGLVEVDPDAGTATVTLKDEAGNELCRRAIEAD